MEFCRPIAWHFAASINWIWRSVIMTLYYIHTTRITNVFVFGQSPQFGFSYTSHEEVSTERPSVMFCIRCWTWRGSLRDWPLTEHDYFPDIFCSFTLIRHGWHTNIPNQLTSPTLLSTHAQKACMQLFEAYIWTCSWWITVCGLRQPVICGCLTADKALSEWLENVCHAYTWTNIDTDSPHCCWNKNHKQDVVTNFLHLTVWFLWQPQMSAYWLT